MTPAAAGTLLHCLGLLPHQSGDRNHFVTSASPDPEVLELVELGYFRQVQTPSFLPEADRVFQATPAGREAAATHLAAERAKAPKQTKAEAEAKSRYRIWLRLSDVWPDLSFGEFLRRRLYSAEVREGLASESGVSRSMWA